jgi:hypothetical protein
VNEKKAERSELEVKSKYSETEEFILLHLYDCQMREYLPWSVEISCHSWGSVDTSWI